MIKGPIQEDITLINIYTSNIGVTKYIKQILTHIKGEINNNTIIISSGIMKLSRKSKITFLNDIYGSNVIEIDIKDKIINKKYWFYKKNMVFLNCKQDRA